MLELSVQGEVKGKLVRVFFGLNVWAVVPYTETYEDWGKNYRRWRVNQ